MEKRPFGKLAIVPTNDSCLPFRVLPLHLQPAYSSLAERVQAIQGQTAGQSESREDSRIGEREMELIQVQASLERVRQQLEDEAEALMRPFLAPFLRSVLNALTTLNQWALMVFRIETSLTTEGGFSSHAVPYSPMVRALRDGNFEMLLNVMACLARLNGLISDAEAHQLMQGRHISRDFNEIGSTNER